MDLSLVGGFNHVQMLLNFKGRVEIITRKMRASIGHNEWREECGWFFFEFFRVHLILSDFKLESAALRFLFANVPATFGSPT